MFISKSCATFQLFFLSPVRLLSIGYPVVTLGFGFKSYVSYKMRLRKQKEVQKENEFYMQLLQQALPPEQQMLQRQEREAEEGTPHTHLQLSNAQENLPHKTTQVAGNDFKLRRSITLIFLSLNSSILTSVGIICWLFPLESLIRPPDLSL